MTDKEIFNEEQMAAPPASETELRGQVERITFRNAENGYTVLRLSVHGHAEYITAVGVMPEPAQGEMLTMYGQWTHNAKYGMQFKANRCEPAMPTTSGGVEKFLASGLIHGIGPATAKRIVEKFGKETIQVLDKEPMRLVEIKGISEKRAAAIAQSWHEQREIREVMLFLQGYGIGAGYAMRIFRVYHENTIAVLKDNPYRVALDVQGIGFTIADRIAQKLGIAGDSPLRIRAGVQNVLNAIVAEGHVYAPLDRLAAHTAQTLHVSLDQAREGIEQARLAEEIVVEKFTDAKGKEQEAVYLPAFHYAETRSALNMRKLVEEPYNSRYIDCEAVLPRLEQLMDITFSPEQREAITAAVNSKVMVITGGPGTGKTTLIRAVLRLREDGGYRVMLAAPTGRAARRMAEATGHEAKTIHRMLEYTGSPALGGDFTRDETNPLECDLLIVDEASMIDQILFHHLLKAVPRSASLILVGDVNQLPSVSPGNVLKDLIESGICPVFELNEIFRQGRESSIVVNAHRVNDGLMPLMPEGQAPSDFYFIEPRIKRADMPADLYRKAFEEASLQIIKKLVAENIPRHFNFDPVNDIQVLAPMHNGSLGTKRLNIELQKVLNKGHGASVQRLERVFKEGDKVMQIRNDYDKDVYNGDIGTVEKVDGEASTLTVRMETGLVNYDFAELEELVHAYAVSIHKSQGSEYPAVIIPLVMQHYVMLQRNLLYTAITRGKKLVVIVGDRRALRIAVENDRTRVRCTRLAQRLRSPQSDENAIFNDDELEAMFREMVMRDVKKKPDEE